MTDARQDSDHLAAVLHLVATIAFVTAPFFSGDFGGFDPEQFPIPQDGPPVQPAGYAFAIWSVIYIWLAVQAITGLFQRADDPDWRRLRWPMVASLGIGASWIAVAQISPVAAMVQIWVMLAAALAALYLTPTVDRWRAQAPTALYAGWLTAASCVSIGLVGAGWGIGPGAVGWAYISLILALVIAVTVLRTLDRAPEYAIGVVWALIAVAVHNWGSQWGVVGLALLGAVIVGGAATRVRLR